MEREQNTKQLFGGTKKIAQEKQIPAFEQSKIKPFNEIVQRGDWNIPTMASILGMGFKLYEPLNDFLFEKFTMTNVTRFGDFLDFGQLF